MGILGHGRFGRFLHRAWGREVAAVCDERPITGAELSARVFQDRESLLEEPDMTIISIATEPATHAALAITPDEAAAALETALRATDAARRVWAPLEGGTWLGGGELISSSRELFERHPGNPILTAKNWPYPVNAVFNPGAALIDGETVLLVRVEDRTGLSHLTVARSRDGYTDWRIDPEPTFPPDTSRYEEAWGIEDPRITEGRGGFLVVYTGFSRGGPLVCLAATGDFRSFERQGVLMSPEDKDGALFPTLFGGRWALIHRCERRSNPVALAGRIL